jgi:hypothetical protein
MAVPQRVINILLNSNTINFSCYNLSKKQRCHKGVKFAVENNMSNRHFHVTCVAFIGHPSHYYRLYITHPLCVIMWRTICSPSRRQCINFPHAAAAFHSVCNAIARVLKVFGLFLREKSPQNFWKLYTYGFRISPQERSNIASRVFIHNSFRKPEI